MKLSQFIKPNINAARSVNLERDHERMDHVQDYHITVKTLEILRRFADALRGERVTAWSLTGPYGMGKSAFLNYLLALTGSSKNPAVGIALDKLQTVDPAIHAKLISGIRSMVGDKGFFQVYATAAYEPVNNTLARGLQNAVTAASLSGKSKMIEKLKVLGSRRVIESPELYTFFQEVCEQINRPFLIVVDEFGKNLDYMSHYHERGDIFILQQLAEMDKIYLWVCLHQAFDEYAVGLSTVQRREWGKVQGRFEDISFLESTTHMLLLMRNALLRDFQGDVRSRIKDWAERAKIFISKTFIPNQKDLDEETIAELYPLHPVASIALIEFCRRFAQNDRTLLSFMCSGDRLALPAYLDRTELREGGELPTVGLHHLYDYFFKISTTAYINRAESQRWIEIHNMVKNAGSLSNRDQVILKTIGVLNLLSGTLGVTAQAETIAAVIGIAGGGEQEEVKKALEDLVAKGILLYREYAGEYRLWEGSDFNVQRAIQEKKTKLAVGPLEIVLQEYLPLSPLIASRHAYQSGTVRRFECRWMGEESLSTEIAPQKGFDGLFLYSFGTLPQPHLIPKQCRDGRPLLIAYVPSRADLHELALEVAAVRSVLEESPELMHDGVARREVKYRIKVAEQKFREHLLRLYSPASDRVQWYSQGKQIQIHSSKELTAHLSDLCDHYYRGSPRIGNEMVSYQNLSSAAARARRELVEAMATKAAEEQLGLKGFGPEVAIYRSLLLAEGLHVLDKQTDEWRFTLEGKDPRLTGLWKQIDKWVEDAGDQGITVADILSLLQEPPFGMRLGPAPIYICLYILARSDEIAVFQEGIYRPYLTSAEMALILKRPEFFVLKSFVSTEEERKIFAIYRGLITLIQLEEEPGLRNSTMLGVVGPLIRFGDRLPAYTRNTKRISQEAKRVRSVLQTTTEPMRLLFEELPLAVGMDLNENFIADRGQEELRARLRSALKELEEAYPNLNAEVQNTLLQLFKADDLHSLCKAQNELAKPLVDICDEPELRAVLQAFARNCDDPADWVRGIAGIVAKKPIDSWNDQDFMPFAAKLRDYVERMKQLEVLATTNGFLVHKDSQLLSLMTPDGRIRREVVKTVKTQNAEVQEKVSEILALPGDMSRAVLVALAESLVGRSKDGQLR